MEGSVGAVQAGMVVDLIRGEGTVVDGDFIDDAIERTSYTQVCTYVSYFIITSHRTTWGGIYLSAIYI